MEKRFVAIWFRHLVTNWMTRRQPDIKQVPFATSVPVRNRMVIKSVNEIAQAEGVLPGMAVADCRAILPTLQVFDHKEGQEDKLLSALAEWMIRYTPVASVDIPDGLILDVSGCSHLWGGEQLYLKDILTKLNAFGYEVQIAMADTIGTAWAISRYGQTLSVIEPGKQLETLLSLPAAALRLETPIIEKLEKLGLYQISQFINMPRQALRRRFGAGILMRLDQALGQAIEVVNPLMPVEPYQERLPSLEPIRTATGIEIALKKLLETLCKRLTNENKGIRTCVFKCFRIDNNIQQIAIGTHKPSRNAEHLFKLFEIKIATLEPDLGIELFLLEAPIVEPTMVEQNQLWNISSNADNNAVAELIDRIAIKVGPQTIRRYLPTEHYWPERVVTITTSLEDKPTTGWREEIPRPIHLLSAPEPIEVTVPIPDYPPMLFHYKGQLHKVKKADGPERIEQEWWLQQGFFRDYYCVEDEEGGCYWLFRLGHYDNGEPKWFMHGFFA